MASKWLIWGSEAAATAILAIISIVTSFTAPPTPLTFTERDPTFSYQLTIPETVPLAMLIGLSVFLPLGIIVFVHIINAVKYKLTGETPATSVFKSFLWLALSLGQCICIAFAITNCIKIAVGRQRPNFFALCNYQGYRDALSSGNFTEYFALTTPGIFGSLENCRASNSDIWEGQKSFPSGHSSLSFAGLLFASLYLRAAFGVPKNTFVSVPAVIAAAPLVLSSWIAISRVRDRWHNPDDIAVGSLIGILSALVAWWHYLEHRAAGRAPDTGAGKLEREDGQTLLPSPLGK